MLEDRPELSLTWFEIWKFAVLSPNLTTYRALLRQNPGGGCLWVVIILVPLGVMFANAATLMLWAVAGVQLLFSMRVIVTTLIAWVLGGRWRYRDLAFLTAAFEVPLVIGVMIFSSLVLYVTRLPVVLYVLIVVVFINDVGRGTIVVKAIHEIGWVKAFIAYVVPYVLLGLAGGWAIWYVSNLHLNWD